MRVLREARIPFDGEEHVHVRLYAHDVVLDVIAGADLRAHAGRPIVDVPFQADRGDDGWSVDGDDSHVGRKDAASYRRVDCAAALGEGEGDASFREQPQSYRRALLLLANYLMEQTEALVNAASQRRKDQDLSARRGGGTRQHGTYCLAEVRAILIGVTGYRNSFGGVVFMHVASQGIQIPMDDVWQL